MSNHAITTIRRTITASKGGMLRFLGEQLDYARNEAQSGMTRRRRDEQRGFADGLRFAMHAIRDWDMPPQPDEDESDLLSEDDIDRVVPTS